MRWKTILASMSLVVISLCCLPPSNTLVTKTIPNTGAYNYVNWKKTVLDEFTVLYDESKAQGVEIGACVFGRGSGDTIFVERSILAKMEAQTANSALLFCDDEAKGYLGTAHTHLNAIPVPSKIDIKTFDSSLRDAFMIVLFERTKLVALDREYNISILLWK